MRIAAGYKLLLLSPSLLLLLSACDASDPCDAGEKHVQGACVPDDGSDSTSSSGKGGSGGSDGKGGKGGASEQQDAAMSSGGSKDAGPKAEPKDSGAPAAAECSASGGGALHDDCSTDADCNCDAPYCAKMPGAAMGFCTVFCNPDPDDCPDGYKCFDLTTLGVEGYEPFCVAKS